MKRGKVPLGIVLGFVVMILLFGVIAWAFRPATTGQVVAENEVDEANNFVSKPFELRAWVVNLAGVQVDLENAGAEDYVVNSIEVKNCGFSDYGKRLNQGESRLFSIKCNLVAGEKFSQILVVKYSSVDGGEEKTAFGNIEDIV